MIIIEGGVYQHYKGGLYRLVTVVRHSETLEEMALYETLYENELSSYWVRPLSMFLEMVSHEGKLVPRFNYVGDT